MPGRRRSVRDTVFDQLELNQLRFMVATGQGFLVPLQFIGPERPHFEFSKGIKLFMFLNSLPYGQLAQQALMQRSRTGRLRYLDGAIAHRPIG